MTSETNGKNWPKQDVIKYVNLSLTPSTAEQRKIQGKRKWSNIHMCIFSLKQRYLMITLRDHYEINCTGCVALHNWNFFAKCAVVYTFQTKSAIVSGALQNRLNQI